MKKTDFKWDADALIPDSIEIKVPVLDGETRLVTLHEMVRRDLDEFLTAASACKMFEKVEETVDVIDPDTAEVVTDENGTPQTKTVQRMKAREFKEISADRIEVIAEFLARSSRGATTKEFWLNEAAITGHGIGKLVSLLYEINHVDAILACSGNWMMLPRMMALAGEASDESQNLSPDEISPES